MKDTFDRCLPLLLKHEGLWSDHPEDPGGATMLGITLRTYSAWLGRQATKEELRNIPNEHVRAIYKSAYWDKIRGDDLPIGVDYAVFDMAVNSGPMRAATVLQRALGVTADGVIGPKTMQAAMVSPAAGLVGVFCDKRLDFLRSLPHFQTFGRGWSSRVKEVRGDAIRMVTQSSRS